MPTHYFLGTRLLASSPHPPWWSDSQPSRLSIAHFCPTCGELWGRVVIPGAKWQVANSGCRSHPFLDSPPGSFIFPWRRGCPDELPAEVLSYELSLLLQEFP